MKIYIKPEEEALYKGLKENYGSSFYISGVYLPEWYKRSKMNIAVFIIFKISNVIGALLWWYSLVKSAILRPNEFHVLTECVHMTSLLTVLLLIPNIFSSYPEEMKRLLSGVGVGLYHYGDTLDEKTKKLLDDVRQRNHKQRKLLTNIMVSLILIVCMAHCLLRPIGDLLTNDRLSRPDDPDGFVYMLPMDLWYYASNTPFGIFIAYLHLAQLFIWGGHVINILTTLAIVFAHTLCSEYEILCLTMRRLITRAKFLYEKMNTKQRVKDIKSDPIFHQCLRRALRDTIRHQQALMKYGKDLKQFYLYPILALVLLTTFLLCFGGIIFTTKGTPVAILVLYTAFILGEIYNLFVYCYFGGRIKSLSLQVGEELYNTNWIEFGSVIKQEILIIQSSAFIKCGISAGGFNDVDMATFSDVLSTAFSYFNIVNAVRN